jgi:hypothetical protein
VLPDITETTYFIIAIARLAAKAKRTARRELLSFFIRNYQINSPVKKLLFLKSISDVLLLKNSDPSFHGMFYMEVQDMRRSL